ncbi:MAG: hypothetical protein ACE5ES_03980 [Candidatus Nanoarchaeia archaeon]
MKKRYWITRGIFGAVIYTIISYIPFINLKVTNWIEFPFLNVCLNVLLAVFNPNLTLGQFCFWVTIIFTKLILGFILGILITFIYLVIKNKKRRR